MLKIHDTVVMQLKNTDASSVCVLEKENLT